MAMNLINITINNREYQVRGTSSILKACEEFSIEVPRFCYHEKLSVAGNCRMCLVEVEKSPKPVVSCAMPISKGMVIYTNTPLVQKARESVLEFLLINHPLDCPICDQGGECDLQDEALQYGSDRGRFFADFKRSVEDKDCGPVIKTIMTRCIHCTRCVRFVAEIAGQETMGAFGRGSETEIGTYVQTFVKTELSGNLVDLCPVGALTSKPYAYTARSWELRRGETIDFFDAVGADILVQTRKITQVKFDHATMTKKFKLGTPRLATSDQIVRILPRSNGIFEDNWISDKTRYAFDALNRGRLMSYYQTVKGGKTHGFFSHYSYSALNNRQNLISNFFDFVYEGEFLKQSNSGRVVALFEGHQDFDSLMVSSLVLKYYGITDLHYSNFHLGLNFDLPNFFTLNNGFNSIDTFNYLLLIGTNPRFEASLINTSFRKQHLQRGAAYFTVNSFTDLKYNQTHMGLSLRTLVSLIENRVYSARRFYTVEKSALFSGVDSFKGKNKYVLQNVVRFIGKKFFVKNKTADLLGFIHSNITSMNMAVLGLDIGVRSDLHIIEKTNRRFETVFAIQPQKFITKKWISTRGYAHTIALTTHKISKVNFDTTLPIKTPYEKTGYTYNTEGRIRRFYKVVDAPKDVKALEDHLLLMARLTFSDAEWDHKLQTLWVSKKLWNLKGQDETLPVLYQINYLNFKEIAVSIYLTLFNPTIENFYMSDLISENSAIMGETSIFLNPLTSKYFTIMK